MSLANYKDARAMGQKEYRSCLANGLNPYLLVLDTILLFVNTRGEEPLGLVDIPIDHIVGTKTNGRTNAFAANFMPILEENSEFAMKWSRLADAHLEEGIHDPIQAYEYMNRFFVVEGNKRVSVMKYFNAVSVPAVVRRIIPEPLDTVKSRIYYDFLDFYKLTKVNFVWFSRPGRFRALLLKINGEPRVWTDEERSDFSYAYYKFRDTFKKLGGDRLYGTTGDAFLGFLKICDIEKIIAASEAELREDMQKSWSELAAYSVPEPAELELDPKDTDTQQSVLSKILPLKKNDPLNVLYIYERSTELSAWAYSHDEGRKAAEEFFGDKIISSFAENVSEERFESVIDEEVGKGANVVFVTSSKMMPACLRASVKYPDVKFLNCSVYSTHPTIRSYYGRMYEVKFLAGLIAGAMTQTHKIGYLADYPIYGTPAAVNAFAKGARMTDPYAKIYVHWYSRINDNTWDELAESGADIISGLDLVPPVGLQRAHGLYKVTDGMGRQICRWQMNWGKFYTLIIKQILDGAWKGLPDKENPKAVNYWWGLSADVFDIEYSSDIRADTLQLVSLMREEIISGRLPLFDAPYLSPESIIKMDSFSENVIGDIPDISELTEDAKEIARIQGICPKFREGNL